VSDADITHAKGEERAKRGYAWALEVYGERTKEPRYQAFRALEEMMELCQTQGLGLQDFIRTAEYVAARKIGDTKTEIGDVRLCLDILAENLGLSVDGCYTSCLTRIQFLDPEKCRAKDDAKVEFGLI
jgi:hypothetical protein